MRWSVDTNLLVLLPFNLYNFAVGHGATKTAPN